MSLNIQISWFIKNVLVAEVPPFFIFSHFVVLAFYVKYNEHLRSVHVHCFTEDLTEEEKQKLIKIKKKMKRKVS